MIDHRRLRVELELLERCEASGLDYSHRGPPVSVRKVNYPC